MISLVAERIAELLHISIEKAEKIAPQLQHEIFLNNIIVSLNVVLVVVFFSTFLIVLSIDEDKKYSSLWFGHVEYLQSRFWCC